MPNTRPAWVKTGCRALFLVAGYPTRPVHVRAVDTHGVRVQFENSHWRTGQRWVAWSDLIPYTTANLEAVRRAREEYERGLEAIATAHKAVDRLRALTA